MQTEIDPDIVRFVSKVADLLRVRIQKNLNLQKIVKMLMADSSRSAIDDFAQASGGWKSDGGRLSCGFSSCKGRRATMEDFFDVKSVEVGGQAVYLFGIFDGHGGSLAAQYLKKHLFVNLISHPEFLSNTKLAISETYTNTDEGFLTDKTAVQRDDGSTASTAILVGKNLYLANVGDSRAIISKAGQAIQLTDDHKPNRTDERKRIENAGGIVMWAGTWRVGGVLAMSRAFGNRLLKQFVVAEPEIQEQEVDEQLEYLVLASDGLWDVVKNEEAVTLVTSQNEPEVAAQKLIETALTRGSADNITCIVVRFHHNGDTTTAPSSPLASTADFPSSQTSAEPSLAMSEDVPSLPTQTTQPDSSPCALETPTDSSSAYADSSLAAAPVDVPLKSPTGVSDSYSTSNAEVSHPTTVLHPPGSIAVDYPLVPTENFVPK